MVCGRRSGKSRIASAIAAHTAALADTGALAPGETAVVLICAADKKGAGIVYGYTRALFDEVPALQPLVVGEQASEDSKVLELRHGVRIEVRSSNFRLVRGPTLLCAIVDEVAHRRDHAAAAAPVDSARLRPPDGGRVMAPIDTCVPLYYVAAELPKGSRQHLRKGELFPYQDKRLIRPWASSFGENERGDWHTFRFVETLRCPDQTTAEIIRQKHMDIAAARKFLAARSGRD